MILFTSDWHLQTSGMFAQPVEDGLTTRAQEGLAFIKWLGEYIIEANKDSVKISGIVHCGDMFTQKTGISTALYNTTLDALKKLTEDTGLGFFYMPGNHDMLMKTGAKHHNMYAISKAVENIHVIDEEGEWFVDEKIGVEIFGVQPPFEEHDLPKPRAGCKRRVLVVHENIIGGRFESGSLIETGVSQTELRRYAQKNKIDIVFGGDIHEPQKIKGKPPIYLIGAPMQFNFGDSVSRGFWLYGGADNSATFATYPAGPKYITRTDEDMGDEVTFGPGEYVRFQVSKSAHLSAARAISGKNKNVIVDYIAPDQVETTSANFSTPEAMVEPYVETFKEQYSKRERVALTKLGLELMRDRQ